MKILLVGPEREENLSIRYLSAALAQAGHSVALASFNDEGDADSVLAAARGVDLVGLSMCFQVRAREFLELARRLKQLGPGCRVVAGGHYASCEARILLDRHPEIDLIVIHEGEHTLVEAVDALQAGVMGGLDRIRGIAFRDCRGQVTVNPPRPAIEDLDSIALPDRRGPIPMLAGVPTAYLMGSRGCLGACSYCCITTLHRLAPGGRFRQRRPENIAEEMAELFHRRGIRQFVFHDDNFLVSEPGRNHQRLDALEKSLLGHGVRDIAMTIKCRPTDAEETVMMRLKQMGLIRVFFGIESSTRRGLNCLNRRQTVEDNIRALECARKLGISAQYTIMIFHPDATMDTVRSDVMFMRRFEDFPLNFCRTEIYSGTSLLRRMQGEGRARGSYLAMGYALKDPAADLACDSARRLFQKRCWAQGSLIQNAIGLDHLSAVLGHFYAGRGIERLRQDIRSWRLDANRGTLDLLGKLLDLCQAYPDRRHPQLPEGLKFLVRFESATRQELMDRQVSLRARADELIQAQIHSGSGVFRASGRPKARHAAAALLALSLGACTCSEVCEYAPPPLEDTDKDGLPDECEETIFGTNPQSTDSDGNGVPDGDEDHDQDGLTNLEEQQKVGDAFCYDTPGDGGSDGGHDGGSDGGADR